MEGTLPLTGLYALSFSDPKTSMNKHDISLPHFSATIGEISLYESIHRWGRGILIGGTIASVVAANTLALLHWLRRKRTKSYRYATKSLTALEIGSGVELHIRFDATAYTSLKVTYPNALKHRVRVRAAGNTLSIHRLPYRNRWVDDRVVAELTLASISQLQMVGDANVTATGCNKLDTPFDLLQIGGQIKSLTVEAPHIEMQLRGNAKTDLCLVSDQIAIGYSGAPELRAILQSEGQSHVTATGSGRTLLLGHSNQLSLYASDHSVIQARAMTVTQATLLLSDQSYCQLNVTDKLSYTLSGNSKLLLSRHPKQLLQAEVHDSATLEILDSKR